MADKTKELNTFLVWLVTLLFICIIISSYFIGYNKGSEEYLERTQEYSVLSLGCTSGFSQCVLEKAKCMKEVMILKGYDWNDNETEVIKNG